MQTSKPHNTALPDLESLHCFLAAARHLHFRTAARSVALSPTAFGERIRRLEEEMNAPLFERSTRHVALTEAGHRLVPLVKKLMEDAQNMRHHLADATALTPHQLTIGTRFELGLSWLVPSLGQLAQNHPDRTLHLRFGDSDDLLRAVRTETIDCAVTSVQLTAQGLEYEPLHEEQYVFVAAPQLPPLLTPEDALHHRLLDAHPELPLFRYVQDAAQAPGGWTFARVELLGTIAAIRHRALEGAGVAVLPRYFIQADLQAGRLLQLLPHLQLPTDRFRLVWRRGHALRGAIVKLAAELRELPIR